MPHCVIALWSTTAGEKVVAWASEKTWNVASNATSNVFPLRRGSISATKVRLFGKDASEPSAYVGHWRMIKLHSIFIVQSLWYGMVYSSRSVAACVETVTMRRNQQRLQV